jgi:hypothetical protein
MAVAQTARKAKPIAGRRVRGPHCPRCDQELPAERTGLCTACNKPFTAVPFTPPQRFHREADGTSTESAPCANHEANLAVDACGRCGAFICALCRMETDELVACPACLEQLERDGSLASLRKDLVNYGYLALSFGAGALVISPVAPLFALPALVYVRKNQRQNRDLGETLGVAQQWWAVALSLLGTLICAVFWFAIVAKARH